VGRAGELDCRHCTPAPLLQRPQPRGGRFIDTRPNDFQHGAMTSGFPRLPFTGLALATLLLLSAACGTDPGPGPGGPPDPEPVVCGDGQKAASETCDDGNTAAGDGCDASCAAIEAGFVCATAGQPCTRIACGDGRMEGSEACDDGNERSVDGCTLDCTQVETGYECLTPGAACTVKPGWSCAADGSACRAAGCGDGVVAGNEECEDGQNDASGDPVSGDGCSDTCRLEPGYKCPTVGQACERTVCGDSKVEGTEQCDDGNNDMGDGCSPLCANEPNCTNGTCTAVCGDNVILPGAPEDECDDGNTRSGDGCSAECKKEQGFVCTTIESAPPDEVEIPIVYRDFVSVGLAKGGSTPHPDFNDLNGAETGIVATTLGSDGKPVYAKTSGSSTTHGAGPFNQWYRDTAGVSKTIVSTLTLPRDSATGSYIFDNQTFFPLDGLGWVAEGLENTAANSNAPVAQRNFGFTSEARYWFEFKGTERLEFRGDDDVWVFINEKLALDLGGVHGALTGTVDLSSASVQANLGLVTGRIYEVVVFQAERHTSQSSYKLTLNNFVTRRTECVNQCGDGTVQAGEQCDDGTGGNVGGYGKCSPTCVLGPRCGDKTVQTAEGEQCDDGNTNDADSCTNTCRIRIG
jgi:fibro-slime domain-containing protein